jgi:predicted MPP superfamily phosphohydrolase
MHKNNWRGPISRRIIRRCEPLDYMSSDENAATSLSFRDGLISPVGRPISRRGPWLQLGSVQGFEWNRLDLPIANLPPILEGLRIVHITDLHLTPRWSTAYDDLIGRLRDNPPDLILCSGDFVDNLFDHRRALPILEKLVTQLSSRLGLFAVTGNHDGDLLGPRLARWGINLINKRYLRLETDSATIELIGLPGVKRYSFDEDYIASIPEREIGAPRIVIGHFPDQILLIDSLRADVLLTGHTHGGQMCLPNGRALMTHDALPKKMARGAHRFGETTLIVNRGLGFTRWPIRLFAPAEIIELQLTRSGAKA